MIFIILRISPYRKPLSLSILFLFGRPMINEFSGDFVNLQKALTTFNGQVCFDLCRRNPLAEAAPSIGEIENFSNFPPGADEF